MHRLTIAFVGLAALVAAARATLTTVTVHGESMEPTMEHGEVWLARRRGTPHVGDVVTARFPGLDPESPALVKRVIALNRGATGRREVLADGRVLELPPATAWLEGDNAAASLDSRTLGPVPLANLGRRVLTRVPSLTGA